MCGANGGQPRTVLESGEIVQLPSCYMETISIGSMRSRRVCLLDDDVEQGFALVAAVVKTMRRVGEAATAVSRCKRDLFRAQDHPNTSRRDMDMLDRPSRVRLKRSRHRRRRHDA